MRLRNLLSAIYFDGYYVDCKVLGLECDSRKIEKDFIFVAIKGHTKNGHDYISEAIKRGANTIIHDENVQKEEGINYIFVHDSRKALAQIANAFYGYLTEKMRMVGVTGTNGKTTITTLVYRYLEYIGVPALLIGTNGIVFSKKKLEPVNTTPDIISSLKVMRDAYRQGIRTVIMEVSSQAIKELRVFGFDFDIVLLSNISQDHLDYHQSMADYQATKGFFIASLKKRRDSFVILNKDDDAFLYFHRLAKAQVITYGREDADYQMFLFNEEKMTFDVKADKERFSLKTSMQGSFNVYNILASMSVIDKLGYSLYYFKEFIKNPPVIDGRMEAFAYGSKTIVIDYAHTPDGVAQVCNTLRRRGHLTVVIGCGGNRDTKKRPIMGQIVTESADYVIFTNDNPRYENEEKIIEDILKGVKKDNYEVIYNRGDAIKRAVSLGRDIIAILGKGCEMVQVIKDIKYPYSDKAIVEKIVKEEKNE